jgi:hypothetical protein
MISIRNNQNGTEIMLAKAYFEIKPISRKISVSISISITTTGNVNVNVCTATKTSDSAMLSVATIEEIPNIRHIVVLKNSIHCSVAVVLRAASSIAVDILADRTLEILRAIENGQ